MPQTMLLTKRLATFLSQNTSAQLPSLLLVSPAGKLLASSSPLPASQLRTQATLACSLWQLYQPVLQTDTPRPSSNAAHNRTSSEGPPIPAISTDSEDHEQSSITIQLTDGVMVIRALKCQLLFVAIGASSAPTQFPSSPTIHAQAQHLSSSSLSSPPISPAPHYTDGHESLVVGGFGERESRKDLAASSQSHQGSTAPSEAGSLASTTRRTHINIIAIKRQAEEVGKWLEENLQGFALSSADGR